MAKGFNVKPIREEPLDPTYRLEEEQTTGWYSVGDGLSKEKCQELYDQKLNEGVSPTRLRIIRTL